MTSDSAAVAADRAEVVGFVGIGNMGLPMAARVRAAGYPVLAYDVSRAALAGVEAEGIDIAAGVAELGRRSDVVILLLPNSAVVDQVVAELLPAVRPNSLIVDMGSSEPLRTQALAAAAGNQGVVFIDAPVSGGVRGAQGGTLTIMVGGSDEDVARARPLLEVMGARIEQVGGVGAGHAVKALNNLMSATHLLSACEAVLTAERFGLDPDVVLRAVNSSSGRSASTENKLPNFVRTKTFDSGFGMALMLKDMRIALGLANETGVPCGLSEGAVKYWAEAVEGSRPSADHTEIALWLERESQSDPATSPTEGTS